MVSNQADLGTDEVHIAGIIVHAAPAMVPSIRAQVALLPRALVHAEGDDGRMVITLETGSTKTTLDYMDALRALPGVSSLALVYQHAESPDAMDEEMK